MARSNCQPVAPRLLTTEQAAAYIGVSESKLRELVNLRRIHESRIDSCVRFDVRRLDRFIDGLAPDEDGNPVDRYTG